MNYTNFMHNLPLNNRGPMPECMSGGRWTLTAFFRLYTLSTMLFLKNWILNMIECCFQSKPTFLLTLSMLMESIAKEGNVSLSTLSNDFLFVTSIISGELNNSNHSHCRKARVLPDKPISAVPILRYFISHFPLRSGSFPALPVIGQASCARTRHYRVHRIVFLQRNTIFLSFL